jgi:hypothetical protein
VHFFINANGTQLQDVSYTGAALSCVPANDVVDQTIQIGQIPIQPDGSFTSTTLQDGILSGNPVTFSYTFAGHVHGLNQNNVWRIAGHLRELINTTPTGGSPGACTTNDYAWSATRDTQPPQPADTPPPAGSYSGFDTRNRPVAFTVDNAGNLTDIATEQLVLECQSPALNQLVPFPPLIPKITVSPNGAFAADVGTVGQLGIHPADFAYHFEGHAHGVDPSGHARLAGLLNVTVDTTDTPTQHCTTNPQWWQATGP